MHNLYDYHYGHHYHFVQTQLPVRRVISQYNDKSDTERRSLRWLTISPLRRVLSPTRTVKWLGRNSMQIAYNTPDAYHVQHVCHMI